jgi:hypothetical protein
MKTRNKSGIIQAVIVLAGLIALPGSVSPRAATQTAAPLRLGIIGLDTSHVLRFTELLNDPSNPDHVAGARVVAAFKGGSPDMEQSATRIERFIVKFFRTKTPPVQPEETLEIIAFMEAADISRARGGAPVALSEVMNEKSSSAKEGARGGKR